MRTAIVLLVESVRGDIIGVRFPTVEAARQWEDEHEDEITARGVVRLVSRSEALGRS